MADDLVRRLAAWAADARADAAAAGRRTEAALVRTAAEETTLRGVLLDLAEAGAGLALTTCSGAVLRGVAVAVGTDLVVLRDGAERAVLVPLAAVATVQAPGAGVGGGRVPPLELRLVDVLDGVAPGRPEVQLRVAGRTDPLGGRLWAVGADVLAVRAEAGTVHVPLRAVEAVALLDER